MAQRKTSFVPGEWYHCYTRSIDRRAVFTVPEDYQRFLQGLYLGNNTKRMNRSNYPSLAHTELLSLPREGDLVGIGAYAIMPNHFHLLLQEKIEGGISLFMKKLGTSFSMYFNAKYDHIGNIFIKPFRAKHIHDDQYLRRVFRYIHLNPVELFEPEWKEGKVKDFKQLKKLLLEYPYCSIPDYYLSVFRIEQNILDQEASIFLKDNSTLSHLLTETALYYQELPKDV